MKLFQMLVILAAGLWTASALAVQLADGHVDLQIRFHAGPNPQLTLELSDDDHGVIYRNFEATLVASEASRYELPPGTPLGPEGAPLWILPQTQEPGILFLGNSAEVIPNGSFDGPLRFELLNVSRPGRTAQPVPNAFVWQASQFGGFTFAIDTTDGITAADAIPILAGSHAHFNWGFGGPGVWHWTFRAVGRPMGEPSVLSSTNTTIAFHVLPLTSFETWQSTNWPPATPVSIIGAEANPDQDAFPNLLEYAMGLSPTNRNSADFPRVTLTTADGVVYPALEFQRAKLPDVHLEAVTAASLSASSWAPLTELVLVEDLGLVERVIMRSSVPHSANTPQFFRVRASLK